MMELVSWDDDIPNIWKNKIHVPNHQPEYASSCSTLSFDHGKVPVDMGSKNLLWPTTFGFVRNGRQMVLIISLMQTYHLGIVYTTHQNGDDLGMVYCCVYHSTSHFQTHTNMRYWKDTVAALRCGGQAMAGLSTATLQLESESNLCVK